jgi:adenylate cyclase
MGAITLARVAPPRDRALARQVIATRRQEGVRKISLAVLIACAISVPFSVGVLLWLDRPLGWRLLALCAIVALAEGGVLLLHGRGLYRGWFDWVLTGIEVSIPSVVLALDATSVGPAYALTSAPAVLYFPTVLFSALRLRPKLVLAAGTLAAAEYLGAALLLQPRISRELVAALPSLSTPNLVQRSSYLLFAGVLSYWVCRSLLDLMGDLVTSVRQELKVRSTLGRQVTKQVAEVLLSDEHARGEVRCITVVVVDLRGFTRFAEQRTPGEVVAFLNCFFAQACEVVDQHGGIVNKFLGDGLLALFGAPLHTADHARRAARAALRMAKEVEHLLATSGASELGIGIGIHTGEAVVGITGSEQRSEYTAIGDTVNLASRIEGLNRQLGTRILLSEVTRRAIGPGAVVRPMGETQVKGREQPVELSELLDLTDAGDGEPGDR